MVQDQLVIERMKMSRGVPFGQRKRDGERNGSVLTDRRIRDARPDDFICVFKGLYAVVVHITRQSDCEKNFD